MFGEVLGEVFGRYSRGSCERARLPAAPLTIFEAGPVGHSGEARLARGEPVTSASSSSGEAREAQKKNLWRKYGRVCLRFKTKFLSLESQSWPPSEETFFPPPCRTRKVVL